MTQARSKAARRAVETRRVYKFEDVFFAPEMPLFKFASRPRSLAYLRRLAAVVWAKHGKGRPMPAIAATDLPYSFCDGASIGLAKAENTRTNIPHNTIDVLLHELTHAVGFGTHGKGFTRKYAQFLVQYGGCARSELHRAMAAFKLKP